MRRSNLLLTTLLVLLATGSTGAQDVRSARPPTQSRSDAAPQFDHRESAALFVGVREFTHDRTLTEVRYGVDDAVDLAYAPRAPAPPYFGKLGSGSHVWYGVVLPTNQMIERLDIVDRDNDGRRDISIWTLERPRFLSRFRRTDHRALRIGRREGRRAVRTDRHQVIHRWRSTER